MNRAMVCKIFDINPNNLKVSKGNFVWFQSFFYGMFSNKDEKMKNKILSKAAECKLNVTIIDSGMHYHDFVGGAKSGSARDSYHYVTFQIKEE